MIIMVVQYLGVVRWWFDGGWGGSSFSHTGILLLLLLFGVQSQISSWPGRGRTGLKRLKPSLSQKRGLIYLGLGLALTQRRTIDTVTNKFDLKGIAFTEHCHLNIIIRTMLWIRACPGQGQGQCQCQWPIQSIHVCKTNAVGLEI